MARYDYDLVVIGGGAAGLTTTSGAAQLGVKSLLIEKEHSLGGDCLHYGCVPSKTLIKSASVYHMIKNAEKYGLPAVQLEPVDFKNVAERIRGVISVIQEHDTVERFSRLGAEVVFDEPRFIDEHTVELSGRKITGKKFLIATGSTADVPAIPGLQEAGFITNKEIFSLEKLPEHLLVVGGGAIAIEMAQAFSRLGSKVSVIQRSDQILSKEDEDLANSVMVAMQDEGVVFYLGSTIDRVETDRDGKKIILSQNGEEIAVAGSEILIALGRKVNSDGLGLNHIQLEHDSKGIKVDNRLRTNHKHIFSAGDVIGKHQFTHAAGYEGGIVVTNAVFNLPRKVNYQWMPWCTFSDPELASIGINEKVANRLKIEYTLVEEKFECSDRGLAEEATKGKIKMLLNKKGQPLGVQILGPHGGELIAEWIAVLNGKTKLSAIAGAIHPYPTLAEINKKVAGSIFSEKIFSEKVRKVLATLFGYRGSGPI